MYYSATSVWLVILIVIVLDKSNAQFYPPSENIVELNESNFDLVLKDKGVWVVQFYVPWCKTCQNFRPVYRQIASKHKGVFKMGIVNSDMQKKLSKRYDVKRFPTIKIFGGDKTKAILFAGLRNEHDLVKWAMAEVNKLK